MESSRNLAIDHAIDIVLSCQDRVTRMSKLILFIFLVTNHSLKDSIVDIVFLCNPSCSTTSGTWKIVGDANSMAPSLT